MTAPRRDPAWLRLLARLVPASDRDDWLDEWRGELAALGRDRRGFGRRLGFALGALPHAVSLRGGGSGGGGLSDLRYAARTLLRRPRFTLVAAVTLALGIAVNGALVSLVHGLLLRPPAGVAAPGELVQLARSYDDAPRWDNFSWPALEALRDADHLFAGVAGSTGRSFVLGEGTGAELVPGAYVTGDWFDVLGVRPAAGRLVQPADDRPDAPAVVVVSHGLWTRLLGRDPAAVGSTLHVGGQPHRVVGVAPPGFAGVDKLGPAPELFVPTATMPPLGIPGYSIRTAWGFSWIDVVARLRPDRTAASARAGLDGVSMAMREADDDDSELRVLLAEGVGLSPDERSEAVRLGRLMAVVSGLVLILTCANVAGLFLARAVDRRSEFAVRRTLGAGGGRIVRQLLTESALLAGLATALAAPLLLLASGHLGRIVPASVAVSFAPDRAVWFALVGLGLGAGLLFGGVPAVLVARRAPARGLGSGRTTGSRGTHRIRNALVVGQLAVSLGLLAGAGLLVRSVRAGLDARPGLDPTGVLAATLDLELTGRYDAPEDRIAFLDRVVAAAEGRAEIAGASVSSSAPFLGPFTRMSRAPLDAGPDVWVEAEAIFADAGWFDQLGLAVVEGRGFDPAGEAEPVALVNQRLARRFWPDGSAVGRHLHGDDVPIRVVGVVADARNRSLRSEAGPAVYEPLARSLEGRYVVQVRGRPGIDDAAVAAALRGAVADVDPGLPVPRVLSLQDRMAATLGETRTLGTLVTVFAALALLLGALGLYASVAYAVARRTRDLAVRLAVGARPGAVFGDVVLRGLLLAGVGVGLGLLLAAALGRAIQGTLYGVGAFDIPTLALVATIQVGVALTATAIPARRATRVDPARALREEA